MLWQLPILERVILPYFAVCYL